MKTPELLIANEKKNLEMRKLQKRVRKLYQNIADDFKAELERIPQGVAMSEAAAYRKIFLEGHVKGLEKEIDNLTAQAETLIQQGMSNTAKYVLKANRDLMRRAGLVLDNTAFSHVPTNVVQNIVDGKVYKGNWEFSRAIWGASEKTKADLYTVVTRGIAENKSTVEIAKDLEKYVSPSAKKDWNWSKVYPGTNSKVDYSAQRLARTLVQHAYQQAYQQSVQYNPFVTGSIWHSSLAPGRTCSLCQERDGKFYKKGTEPLDHPSGLCYLECVIPDDPNAIADRLADWAHGKSDPALDKYVKNAYGNDTSKYQKARNATKRTVSQHRAGPPKASPNKNLPK